MLISFDYLFRKYKIKPEGILHVGANEGQEAEMYDQLGVKNVIWVEAIPEVFAKLQKNIAKYPGQSAILACVGDQDGKEVVFNVANNDGQSSSYLQFGTHAKVHPTVKYVRQEKMVMRRLDSLLMMELEYFEPCSGWFLNMDLQGVELDALRGMGSLLHDFDWAYIEVNAEPLYEGCALVQEVDDYLAKFKFLPKETKWTGAKWGDRFYLGQ